MILFLGIVTSVLGGAVRGFAGLEERGQKKDFKQDLQQERESILNRIAGIGTNLRAGFAPGGATRRAITGQRVGLGQIGLNLAQQGARTTGYRTGGIRSGAATRPQGRSGFIRQIAEAPVYGDIAGIRGLSAMDLSDVGASAEMLRYPPDFYSPLRDVAGGIEQFGRAYEQNRAVR